MRSDKKSLTSAGISEAGSITALVVFMCLALVVVCGVVFDAGGALGDRERAADIAEQAARAGADQLLPSAGGQAPIINQAAARTTALRFLGQAGVSGDVVTAADHVTVTVDIRHETTLLQVAGISDLSIHGTATARPLPGLRTAAPSPHEGG